MMNTRIPSPSARVGALAGKDGPVNRRGGGQLAGPASPRPAPFQMPRISS